MLGALSAEERLTVVQAMDVLRPVFTPGRRPEGHAAR
jgi:hypothetical protein